MKRIVFSILISFSSIAAAQDWADYSSYVVESSTLLLTKKDIASTETVEVSLAAGDVLIFLEQQRDEQGQLWLRFGKEQDSGVEVEREAVDFWLTEENWHSLPLTEEILSRMTYCYRYVKKYLLKKGFVNSYLPGASAFMAAKVLPKHGFVKSNRKPSSAITYDVCVYKGGPSGHGHIEVLDPNGWYYGYGYFKYPIKNRIFLGCFFRAQRR